jgi:hypothetical protein
VQVVTLQVAHRQGIYDQEGIARIIAGTLETAAEYDKSLVVFDVDSLVGVREQVSEVTSQGTTVHVLG